MFCHISGLQRADEQQQIPLFSVAEPFKVLRYPDGFSLVTSDSIFNAHAISVVHEAGSRMNGPEWRSTQSVSSALNNLVETGLLRGVDGCQMPRITLVPIPKWSEFHRVQPLIEISDRRWYGRRSGAFLRIFARDYCIESRGPPTGAKTLCGFSDEPAFFRRCPT